MQRFHPRQLPIPLETASNTPTPTPTPSSTSSTTVAVPVLSAVGGTIFIFLCLAMFVTYQVRAVMRYRAEQARLKSLAKANLDLDLNNNSNNNNNNNNNSNSDPTYLEEKGGPPEARPGAVQFTDNSQTLLFRTILPASSAPSAPFPPPGYTSRSPQSIVIGINQIEKKAVAVALAGGNTSWRTEPWQQPKSRSPQDHLKQEQLERVMKLHRQQMEELQALLRRHMLDNTQFLSPHTVVAVDDGGDGSNMGGGDEDGKGKQRWRIGQSWSNRLLFRSLRRHRSRIRGRGGGVVSTQGQSPQGIDSPMVQPDDVVRGPEAIIIPYPPPPPPPRLNTSLQILGRPSHVTADAMSSRGSDWFFESPTSELSMAISEELRLEERSMLVDCFEKINAHYERQFQIAESEILHGSSSSSEDDIDDNDDDNDHANADADDDDDDDPDRIEPAESEK